MVAFAVSRKQGVGKNFNHVDNNRWVRKMRYRTFAHDIRRQATTCNYVCGVPGLFF